MYVHEKFQTWRGEGDQTLVCLLLDLSLHVFEIVVKIK